MIPEGSSCLFPVCGLLSCVTAIPPLLFCLVVFRSFVVARVCLHGHSVWLIYRDELEGSSKVFFSSSVLLNDPDFSRHPRYAVLTTIVRYYCGERIGSPGELCKGVFVILRWWCWPFYLVIAWRLDCQNKGLCLGCLPLTTASGRFCVSLS